MGEGATRGLQAGDDRAPRTPAVRDAAGQDRAKSIVKIMALGQTEALARKGDMRGTRFPAASRVKPVAFRASELDLTRAAKRAGGYVVLRARNECRPPLRHPKLLLEPARQMVQVSPARNALHRQRPDLREI